MAEHTCSGPTAEDKRLAARLQQMTAELDRARAELPTDALHSDVYQDLRAATAALQRAHEKLLLAE